MITDTEVRVKGVQALTNSLGSVGAERVYRSYSTRTIRLYKMAKNIVGRSKH